MKDVLGVVMKRIIEDEIEFVAMITKVTTILGEIKILRIEIVVGQKANLGLAHDRKVNHH